MDAAVVRKQEEETFAFLSAPLDPTMTDKIRGNVTVSVKELPVKWLAIFRRRGNGFCNSVAEKLKVREVSIDKSVEDPQKLEGSVACEVEVTPDMCDDRGMATKAS